jgi:hypothetical protein
VRNSRLYSSPDGPSGQSAAFEVEHSLRGAGVARGSIRSYTQEIVRIASRRAGSFGAASVVELAAEAVEQGIHVSEAQVRNALARHASAEFLDDDWFWLPSGRNRLATLGDRILAVASPLDGATIRAGVCRTYARRQATLVPPAGVMDAFYRAHPNFTVDAQGRVRPAGRLDYMTELGKTDRIFVDVLRSSWTGVLDRVSFHDACIARGMTTRTFNVRTAYSAVLDHPAADIWCLRGTRVSPITAAALRHATVVDNA